MLNYISLRNRYGKTLYGTLHKVSNGAKGSVLIAHGHLSSNRIGPQRLYYEIAEILRQTGYNVLRLDLTGMGESEGDLQNVKFEDHVYDLDLSLQWFKHYNDRLPISLIGHSSGCNIGLELSSLYSKTFEKIICIAPFCSTESSLESVFSPMQITELKTNGFTYRKGVYADESFFLEHCLLPTFINFSKFNSDLMTVIFAEKDQYMEEREKTLILSETGVKSIMIKDADHNFMSLNARRSLYKCIARLFC